jgi:hypothetical protein
MASQGRNLTLPPRPAGIVSADVCALSGEPAGPDCPQRKHEHFVEGSVPEHVCSWHRRQGGRVIVRYPPQLEAWLARRALPAS